jgi:hypothetical protein
MNEIVTNRVEDTVWKSRKESSTNTSDDFGIQQWGLLETFKLQFDRGQELFPKARTLRFVPLSRLAYFTQRPSRKL